MLDNTTRVAGPVNGVIMILYNTEKTVVAQASDFERSGYGGFTLQESQKIRCKRAIARENVKKNCSTSLGDAISQNTAEDIMADVIKNGYILHTIFVETNTGEEQ